MKEKVTTDGKGVGKYKYSKALPVRVPVTVSLVDNAFYDPNTKLRLDADIYPRLKTIISNNPQSIGTTHYNEKCTLNCSVKDEFGAKVTGYKVTFKSEGVNIKTPTLDSNGNATVEYVPAKGSNFKYTCNISNNGIYGSSENTFTVTNDKQTPLVTIKKSDDTIHYGDVLKISTGLTESSKAVKPNAPISGMTLGIYRVDSSNNGNITFDSTPETKLGSVVTGKDGTNTISLKNIPPGSYKIYSVFWGDKRDTKDQNVVLSRNPLYHWAWNYCLVDVNPRPVNLEGDSELKRDGGYYTKYLVKLVDKKGVALADKEVFIKVTNLSNNKTLSGVAKTSATGECGVDFVEKIPTTTTSNLIPCVVRGWNINNNYKVQFGFNNNNGKSSSYTNYASATFTGQMKFTKADTKMIYTSNDDELKVQLMRTVDGAVLSNKPIKFVEGNKTYTKTTDSKGWAVLTEEDEVEGGDHNFTIKFLGDDLYNSSQIATKWTNVIIDDCTTLATFTTMTERWYASYDNYAWYGRRRMRDYCSSVYNTGRVDDADGVTARTGVILKCDNIASNGNCDITFKLKFKTGRDDGGFGGHFGLVQPDWKTAEKAPARFEFYKNPYGYFNKYFIHGNDRNNVKNFKYMTFEFDKWYNMMFQVRGQYVTCKNLDTGEQYKGDTKSNTVGLQPYIMVFLNYCEMSIRELKMELK